MLHETLDFILFQKRDNNDEIILHAIDEAEDMNVKFNGSLFITRIIFWESIFKGVYGIVERLLVRGAVADGATFICAADYSPDLVNLLVRYGCDMGPCDPMNGDYLNDIFVRAGASIDFGGWGKQRRDISCLVLSCPRICEDVARMVGEMLQ